jgi:iron(III) transport system ATP-binding protein
MSEVRLKEIVKHFAGIAAVERVSIVAKEGELTTLLGPSGCGKTTTLRMIAGLETPEQGEIWIGDRLVAAPDQGISVPAEKRNIGMVFQSYAIWPHKTAFENVAYPLRLRHYSSLQIRERVSEVFSLLRLEGLEKRYPGQLSGGQQQRVALGRAIVYRPKLLLLDEPLANLDAKVREAVRFELKELQQKLKFTAIYVTHDQSEAMVLSNKVVIMDRGRAVQEGTASEIYRNPASKFVADFVGQSNFLAGKLHSQQGSTGVVDLGNGTTLPVHLPAGVSVGSEVSVCVRPEDFELLSARSGVRDRNNDLLEGTIKTKAFHGNIVSYLVQCGEKQLQVQGDVSSDLKYRESDKVFLRVRKKRAQVVLS